MPCCWEIAHHKSTLVGVLHTDSVSLQWALGLRQLRIPNGAILPVSGQPFGMARNTICMKALELGVDTVLMLDSDIIPPPDGLERLLSHSVPLVSGLYSRRSPPHSIPVMQRPLGNWVTKYPPNSLVEVDVVGTGFMLISREILENLKPQRPGSHWFWWAVDYPKELLQLGEHCVSEDFSFCMAVKRQLGIPTLVDTGVICRHLGLAEFTHGNVQPASAFMVN